MNIVTDTHDGFNGDRSWKGTHLTSSPYFIHLDVLKNFSTPILKPEMYDDRDTRDNICFGLNSSYRINKYLGTDSKIQNIKYIYPIGVHASPEHWRKKNGASIFSAISMKHILKAQKKEALIVFDNSLEGYYDDTLFDFFKEECDRLNIPVESIMFITGDLNIHKHKEEYERDNKTKTVKVIGYSHFEADIYLNSKQPDVYAPTFDDHLKYKHANKEKIKVYNFLNRRPRQHRIWMYTMLHKKDLLKEGIVSMNKFSYELDQRCNMGEEVLTTVDLGPAAKTLPLYYDNVPTYGENDNIDAGEFINRLNEQPMLDSFVTIVSEAQFEDKNKAVFLSEKVFKPIAANHPFIVFGGRDSLEYLHTKYGYQTFDAMIPEEYDKLNDIQRTIAILEWIEAFSKRSIEDKLEWFNQLRGVVEYNKLVMENNVRLKKPFNFDSFCNYCK